MARTVIWTETALRDQAAEVIARDSSSTHRLIYKIEPSDRIYIVRFIHGARDFSVVWPQN